MPTQPMEDGGESGLLVGTLADAARLIWSPRALPNVAMTLPVGRALLAGACGWFCVIGAVTAAFTTLWSMQRGNPHDPVSQFISGFLAGGGIATSILIPLAGFITLDADITTEAHRSRVRFLLVLPIPVLLPLIVWSWMCAVEVPIAGSPWWLIAFAAALVTLLMRGWDAMAAASTGDRCVGCGYLLIGLTGTRCPECGRDFYHGQRPVSSAEAKHS